MGQVHDLITKDMTISEVIEKYPSTIETLLMTGVHCIGCHVSYFETLEQGMKGHGMTDEEIKEVIKDKDGLRIEVIPGGCSGYMYNITTEDKINNDDKVFEEKGVKVILDKESLDLLKGSKLDYVDSLQDAGFRIHNPNAKSTCGCGHSFG